METSRWENSGLEPWERITFNKWFISVGPRWITQHRSLKIWIALTCQHDCLGDVEAKLRTPNKLLSQQDGLDINKTCSPQDFCKGKGHIIGGVRD